MIPSLVPAGSSSFVPRVSHQYVDNFLRANNANISTNAPLTYTAVTGTSMEIASNKLHDADSSGVEQHVRAEVPLKSVDHDAQVTLGLYTVSGTTQVQVGPLVRYSSSADTCYVCYAQVVDASTWQLGIAKIVSGARTSLTGTNITTVPKAGDVIRVIARGRSIVGLLNGVALVSALDDSIGSGDRCGVYMRRAAVGVDTSVSEFRFGAA